MALTVTAALGLSSLSASEGEAVPLHEALPSVRREIPDEPGGRAAPGRGAPEHGVPGYGESYAYILKSYNGRVAVFLPGAAEPQMVLDKLVRHLPDYDQIQLERGIPLKDYAALSSAIEDYIS